MESSLKAIESHIRALKIWITQDHVLNPDNILYDHNLLLVANLAQQTKQQAINK